MATELIVGFNNGEVSRNIESRVDLPLYKRSCSICLNYDVLPEGGARNRAGTKFISKANVATEPAYLKPFSYSDDKSYTLEFGANTVRIWDNQTDTAIQTLASVYAVADVGDIQFERSFDVMWMVHPLYPMQTLTRTSVSTFTLEATEFDFPPFLEENETAVTLTAGANTGSTTLTASAPTFSASDVGNYYQVAPLRSGSSTPYGANVSDTAYTGDWLFVGFSSWRMATTGSYKGRLWIEVSYDQGSTFEEYKSFPDTTASDAVAYSYEEDNKMEKGAWIRVRFTGSGGITHNLYVNEAHTPGIAIVTGFTSDTIVDIDIINDISDTTATEKWSEGAFTDANGYPRTITLYEERLWLCGTERDPNMIWGSVTDDFLNFQIGTLDDDAIQRTPPVNGFASWLIGRNNLIIGTTNEIIPITGLTTAKALTPTNFKFNVQTGDGAAYEQPLLLNDATLYVQKGSKKVRELIYSDQTEAFGTRDLSALSKHIAKEGVVETSLQLLPDQRYFSVLRNGQLGILSYERAEEVTAWQRYTTDGEYISCSVTINGDEDSIWYCIKRDGEYFIEKQLDRDLDDGDPYWFVDAGVLYDGGASQDALLGANQTTGYVTVTANSHGLSGTELIRFNGLSAMDELSSVYSIEIIDPNSFYLRIIDGSARYDYCAIGSCATIPSDAGTFEVVMNEVSGLDHIEGKTVVAVGDNKYQGEFTVSGGSITIPEYANTIVAGLPYESTLSPLPIENISQFISVHHQKIISDITVKMKDSIGGRTGTDINELTNIDSRVLPDPIGQQLDPYNIDIQTYSTDVWDGVKRVYIQQHLPLPFEVLSLSVSVNTKGR